jgi:signal transduction histidine kinase
MNLGCDKNRGNSEFGLGLYISAEIIKRQQRRIWLECKEVTACPFYFTLPVSAMSIEKNKY